MVIQLFKENNSFPLYFRFFIFIHEIFWAIAMTSDYCFSNLRLIFGLKQKLAFIAFLCSQNQFILQLLKNWEEKWSASNMHLLEIIWLFLNF
jgi:hypothetical protein